MCPGYVLFMSEANSGVVMLGAPEPERDANDYGAYAGFLQGKSLGGDSPMHLLHIHPSIHLNRSILEQSFKPQGLSLKE